MRADLIKDLVAAGVRQDSVLFQRLVEDLIREEEAIKHHAVADQLRALLATTAVDSSLRSPGAALARSIPTDVHGSASLIRLTKPRHYREDLILPEQTSAQIDQLLMEWRGRTALARYGLEPKKKILLYGPPGTGKTLTAEVIASTLELPLAHIRFDAVVSSYLGETATNLRRIFDFMREHPVVAFFDEFDFIGKQRDDPHEHGEIKRVVNNFMAMLDEYAGRGLVLAATNHPHLLDAGLWRRFDDTIRYTLPGQSQRADLFEKYTGTFPNREKVEVDRLAHLSDGLSGSDIARVCNDAMRIAIVGTGRPLGTQLIESCIADLRWKKETTTE